MHEKGEAIVSARKLTFICLGAASQAPWLKVPLYRIFLQATTNEIESIHENNSNSVQQLAVR
jgi:hypothetical protein